MKWKKNNVVSRRGNFRPILAKFDNSRYWLAIGANCSVATAINQFRHLGRIFCSKSVEIKYWYDDEGRPSEEDDNIVDVVMSSWSDNAFRRELPVSEGQKRQFQYFKEEEVFPLLDEA